MTPGKDHLMEPWQQRVVEERDALSAKLSALQAFIQGPKFQTVSPRHQCLMHRQALHMERYAAVLLLRIEDLMQTPRAPTTCAVCGQLKDTPLRNDVMGGYVCLTCIDQELQKLQQASPPAPATGQDSSFGSDT
jgi:hypothetical protein